MSERQEEPRVQRSEQSEGERPEDERSDEVKAIEEDPAYSPENEMLKDIKGG